MRAFMLPGDIGLFMHSARTDARLERLEDSLGSMSAALEAVYAGEQDPWSAASSRYRYQTRKYEVLLSLLPTGHYRRALDVGCGLGLFTRHLATHADEVIGVDISPSAIDHARSLQADKPNATFAVADVLDLPSSFDGSFDLVIVADVLYYISALNDTLMAEIVRRIASLLKPGGTCMLANHYFFRFDRDSRRSRAIHDAFMRSNAFLARSDHWKPFYLVTLLCRTGQPAR